MPTSDDKTKSASNYHWDHSVRSSIGEVSALTHKSIQLFSRTPAGSLLSGNQQRHIRAAKIPQLAFIFAGFRHR